MLYRLNSTKGWLADAVGNYTVDTKCTWLIEAPEDDDRIRLHLKEFATECGWDHLYIFDGDSVRRIRMNLVFARNKLTSHFAGLLRSESRVLRDGAARSVPGAADPRARGFLGLDALALLQRRGLQHDWLQHYIQVGQSDQKFP